MSNSMLASCSPKTWTNAKKERRALMLEDERHERGMHGGMLRRMAGMEAAMEAAEALAAEQDDEV